MGFGRENELIALANVGYARVSTIDQDPALQSDALAVVGWQTLYGSDKSLRVMLERREQPHVLAVRSNERLMAALLRSLAADPARRAQLGQAAHTRATAQF